MANSVNSPVNCVYLVTCTRTVDPDIAKDHEPSYSLAIRPVINRAIWRVSWEDTVRGRTVDYHGNSALQLEQAQGTLYPQRIEILDQQNSKRYVLTALTLKALSKVCVDPNQLNVKTDEELQTYYLHTDFSQEVS